MRDRPSQVLRHGRAVILAALVLGAAGCGVGTQHDAQLLDRKGVPAGLLGPVTTTTAPAQPSATVTVFFQGPQGLVPVERRVRAPVTVSEALAQLAKGPTAAEASSGLQSPVSTVAPLTVKRVQNGTVVVSVPAGFAELGGQDQIVAAAEIVFTATAVPTITGVLLEVNGKVTEVPVVGGSLKSGPLARADYTGLGGQ